MCVGIWGDNFVSKVTVETTVLGRLLTCSGGANFLSASSVSVWPTVHVLIMTESSLLGPAWAGAHFGNLQVFKLSVPLEEWKGPFRADRDTTRTSYSWAPPLPQSYCCIWLLKQGDGKFRLGSHSLESSLPLGVQVMEPTPDFCGPHHRAVGASKEDFRNWAIPFQEGLSSLTPESPQL